MCQDIHLKPGLHLTWCYNAPKWNSCSVCFCVCTSKKRSPVLSNQDFCMMKVLDMFRNVERIQFLAASQPFLSFTVCAQLEYPRKVSMLFSHFMRIKVSNSHFCSPKHVQRVNKCNINTYAEGFLCWLIL